MEEDLGEQKENEGLKNVWECCRNQIIIFLPIVFPSQMQQNRKAL
jgi:hypothetical protein